MDSVQHVIIDHHSDDGSSVSGTVGSYQSAAKSKLRHTVDLVLKRVPSAASFLSDTTLVESDTSYGPGSERRPVWARAWTVLQRAVDAVLALAALLAAVAWALGATQAASQCINALLGWAILRAGQPSDDEYASASAEAVARQGAVGGAVLHVALIWAMLGMAALGAWCDGDIAAAREHARERELTGAGSHEHCAYCTRPARIEGERERMLGASFAKQFCAFAYGTPVALARAAGAGAIGSAIMQHAAAPLLDRDRAMRAHVVGAAALLVPRAVVAFVARAVFVKDERERMCVKGTKVRGRDGV